jgi:uracil-DNA glycosylase family protein
VATKGQQPSGEVVVVDVPDSRSLRVLREAAASCVRCELHELGMQTVFGEGRAGAWLLAVGEQPGDKEDEEGRPFVGPAGKVLDRALAELGVSRRELYLTNAVKHFRWEPRGKRRIHKTPTTEHMRACAPWLDAEVDAVRPRVLLCLGAVAARAVLGPKFKLLAGRGQEVPSRYGVPTYATVHPASVLRSEDRDAAYRAFVDDLRLVVTHRPHDDS